MPATCVRAANLSPKTQRAYIDAVAHLGSFLREHGMPVDVAAIRREHVEGFIDDQLARLRPASAANRYASLRPFFNWLVEEGEIRESPMGRMRKPRWPFRAVELGVRLTQDVVFVVSRASSEQGDAELTSGATRSTMP